MICENFWLECIICAHVMLNLMVADDLKPEDSDSNEEDEQEVSSALKIIAAAAVVGMGAYLLYKAIKKE